MGYGSNEYLPIYFEITISDAVVVRQYTDFNQLIIFLLRFSLTISRRILKNSS